MLSCERHIVRETDILGQNPVREEHVWTFLENGTALCDGRPADVEAHRADDGALVFLLPGGLGPQRVDFQALRDLDSGDPERMMRGFDRLARLPVAEPNPWALLTAVAENVEQVSAALRDTARRLEAVGSVIRRQLAERARV